MKKIGILTLSASDNCGSLLQAYALQKYLASNFCFDVQIINLRTEKSDSIYSVFPKNILYHPKKLLFNLFYLKSILKQKKGYSFFRENYLNLTKKVYRNSKEIDSIVNDYDYLIAGSDQIWNVYMTDFDDSFFLPWNTDAVKISYAASLGTAFKIDKPISEMVTNRLRDFQYISVREKRGKETISTLTNKDVVVTVDPTLLLKAKEWDSLIGTPLINGPYIFFYSWSYPDANMNKIVQKFAADKGLTVYVINSSKWYKFRPKDFGFKLFEESGPLVFLNLIKNAKYVFVQSFHGAVFSYIFNKRYFFLSERGKDFIDVRSNQLISTVQHQDQVVSCYDDLDIALNSKLVFSSDSLCNVINESKEFLARSLNC